MIEIVRYKVRPFNGDKKLRVFYFLVDFFDPGIKSEILCRFEVLFPFGFKINDIDRKVIDFDCHHVFDDNKKIVCNELVNHDYLAQYLTSSEDSE